MSILIKGMEKPTSCFDCPCYHHKADDGYYDYEICSASGTIFNDGYASVTGHKNHIDPFMTRLDNCPLVPVPEHGRLIDADALMQIIREHDYPLKAHFNSTDNGMFTIGIQQAVDESPTIIPAEESD